MTVILLVVNEWISAPKDIEFHSILFQSILVHKSNMDLNICRKNVLAQKNFEKLYQQQSTNFWKIII